jgi:hypothetical protein
MILFQPHNIIFKTNLFQKIEMLFYDKGYSIQQTQNGYRK